ncbi:hypothetical protein HK405_003089, partial [Cladochytrium tenue]
MKKPMKRPKVRLVDRWNTELTCELLEAAAEQRRLEADLDVLRLRAMKPVDSWCGQPGLKTRKMFQSLG